MLQPHMMKQHTVQAVYKHPSKTKVIEISIYRLSLQGEVVI